ncbi:Cytochrome P450 87A3 [Bienertia sinuspersici]
MITICFIYLVIMKKKTQTAKQVVLLPGYGPIFQTRLLGRPVVISADTNFNRYIVQQEGKLVELWYLDTFSKLFAQEGETRTSAAGFVHKYLRSLTLSHFGSESLREKLLPHLEILVQQTLNGWSSQESIDVKEAALNVHTCSSLFFCVLVN